MIQGMEGISSLSNIQSALSKQDQKFTIPILVDYYLSRISEKQELNAFVEVFADEARNQAILIQEKINTGTAGKLAGMVIGIKDNICYQDHQVSASSKILENYVSPFSATVVERLLAEDAIIIGRLNCDEFAMGASNESSYYGPVKNNADLTKVSGGSSGGAAVAVQAGLCLAALGTDTGGSVRQPAAFCGVVGLKPTYGRVSRNGLIAYASSFDQIGPITKSMYDMQLLMEVISGKDDTDATSSSKPVPEYSSALMPIKQKIAYIKAEASSNLSRFSGLMYGHRSASAKDLESTFRKSRSEGFGTEVKRRIMLGTFVLSAGSYDAYYTKAQKVRRLVQEKTNELLSQYDFLLSPTTPTTAFKFGEKTDNPIAMYLADIFPVHANISGNPAISVPMGKHTNGMPMGVQLMAQHFCEGEMMQLASTI